jgi:hypothetical protein
MGATRPIVLVKQYKSYVVWKICKNCNYM